MKPAYIVLSIFKHLKQKKLFLWVPILAISAAGPLITTYLFSRGIKAIETHQALNTILWIFFSVLAVSSLEIVIRIAAKTRIHYYINAGLIKLQQTFLKSVKVRSKHRKATVQSIRNLTRSIQIFFENFVNSGIASLVSFVSVPIILYFVDRRIFWVEMALIVIYLSATFFYSYKYEIQFERYDETREKFFLKMGRSNHVAHQGGAMIKAVKKLQDIRLFEWISVQNIIVVFQFIITAIIVIDIVSGLKGISDRREACSQPGCILRVSISFA